MHTRRAARGRPRYGINGYYAGFKGDKEINETVYRVDGKTGQMEKAIDDATGPNGICFSPDYKKVYIADTGTRAGDVRQHQLRRRQAQPSVHGGQPVAVRGVCSDRGCAHRVGSQPLRSA
jgi:sugar lactone lactonase YvrE